MKIEKPCIITITCGSLEMTYDSRNFNKPFTLKGSIHSTEALRGLSVWMDRELRIAGVSLQNKDQLDLLRWRQKR